MIQRNFWRNVLPSVIAFAFSGVYSIVDGMFVGQGVGDAGLAAINVAWPVTALVQALGTGLGMAAAVVLSVCIGRRDAAEEHRALGSTAVYRPARPALPPPAPSAGRGGLRPGLC